MAMAEGGARFDIGRVTSRTFELIGRNFVPFAILSLIFAGLPYIALMLALPAMSGGDPSSASVIALVGALLSLVAGMVLQGALTRAAVDDLSGKGVNLGAALSTGLAILLPMIGLGLLMGLGIGIGMILLIVPGVYLALCWLVSAPVLVIERLGIMASIQRSTALTQNHRWALLGLIVLYAIIAMVFQAIVGLAVPGGMAAMMGLPGEAGGSPIVAILLLTILQVVTSMIATVGIAAVYFELRQVKDGVGVTELANVFA
ncbi:MAG: glycerophosphoryl diester phosphodiesterase membrane domain-containing protein [Alphaproteobacteria bacterium]|nr:glycerophosphoryl diester phosphodiesterase membrane domain-containing protein [Alphaproteobacteria bacterium]